MTDGHLTMYLNMVMEYSDDDDNDKGHLEMISTVLGKYKLSPRV